MSEHMMPIPSRIYNAAVGGHVAGADQIIDDETGLTLDKVTGGALEEKEYASGSDNGMGRVVLRKNLVGGVNTLTQTMINKSNTIYVIQYDYTLGENITVPANCVLEFDGGSITNGTIDFNGCCVISPAVPILIGVTPYHLTDINVAWFGILPSLSDNSARLNALFNSFSTNYTKGTVVRFNVGTYKISSTIIVPFEALGLEIWGATRHCGYGHTVITTENENIGTLMIVRGQSDALYGISFIGISSTSKEITGVICKRSETLSEDDNTNDHYCNTETVIENCQFTYLYTGVELWGRHNYLNDNGFTSFRKGIVINSLVQHGQGGGPNRNNYIINNLFHSSNPSISDPDLHYGCIVIDTDLSVENYIANNRNTSWTTFIYGYLRNTQVCNNYCCWSINHIALNLLSCFDSFINSNWFHYNNNYSDNVSGTPIITGSQGGIYVDGACNKSTFINNVITRTGATVFYFNGTTKGCTIANNQFYRNGNATGENASYEIYLPAHASDNVIVNNFALRSINSESEVPNNHFIYLNQLGWDGASNLIQNNYVQSERLQGPYDRKPGLDTKRASNAYSGNQGFMYFDTDNNRPIFWTGDTLVGDNGWVDANGDNPSQT